MERTLTPATLPLAILAAGLALLAPRAGRAAAPTSYTIQPIVKLGDHVADVTVAAGGDFEIGALNDSGQIAFVTENAAGGGMLLQYDNGPFLPIVVAGRDAPSGNPSGGPPFGKWNQGSIPFPVSMNRQGDMAFSASATYYGRTDARTFRWAYQSRRIIPIPLSSGSNSAPLINSSGTEGIAFAVNGENAAGATGSALLFLGPFRGTYPALVEVVLPGQPLPGGATFQDAYPTGLSDAGVIGFAASAGPGSPPHAAYLWENDTSTFTPIAMVGMEIPGLGKVVNVGGPQVNNRDRSAIVELQLNSASAPLGIYHWANGQFTLLFAQGQDMPGGGQLVRWFEPFALNDAGQLAFLAQINENGRTLAAAYLLDSDGTLSLILKSGTMTNLGLVTLIGADNSIGGGIGLNSQGQVALVLGIQGQPETLALLTPVSP